MIRRASFYHRNLLHLQDFLQARDEARSPRRRALPIARVMSSSVATALRPGPLPQLLRSGGVRSLYQPIVDLDSGVPVAYEALARGPQGSPLESPLVSSPPRAATGSSPSSTAPVAAPPSRAPTRRG